MARIYKESRYVLQLLIGKSYVAQYDDVKISFYTKNPSNQVMVDNGITIKRNIAEVMVESTLFDNLEEGLISYIVYGTKDGIPFIEERQSNYFLKTPLDFKPTTCILEDKSVTPSMGERNNDGYIIIEKSEGYDGLSRVVIDPQTLYNEGVEAGRAEGGESGTTCNLGETEFEFSISDFGEIYELYSSDEGYDGWSKVTIRFANNDWAYIYNAGKIFEDYNNGMSPALGNYSYVCGKITEIQEVNTSAENNYASFTLDNCFKISKAKWNYKNKDQFESEDQIKVGACAVVFGVFQDNNGSLQFEEGTSRIIAYQECAGGESGTTCNIGEGEFEFGIEDLGTTYELYSSQESGYDGWSKVTIRFIDGWPVNVYNAGKIFEDYSHGTSPGVGNYGYVCGKITEIQEVNTSADNNYASFTLDNCFKVDKCKWAYWHYNGNQQFESEDQIKVDTCALVYGVFQDNNGALQFEEGTGMIAAYQECETVVESKVVVGETGVKFANSQITEISPIFEFSNITDYSYMFYNAPNIATQPISRMVVNGSADYAFYGAQKILLPTFVAINEGASVKHMFGENHAEMYETINIISNDFPKNIICGRFNADCIDLKILKRGNPYIDFSADEDGSLFVNASLKNYIHIKPHIEQDLSWLTNGCTVERMIIGEDGISYINPTNRDWIIDNIKYLELKGDYSEYGKYEVNGVYCHPNYSFYSLTGIAGCNGLKGDFYFSDKIRIVDLQNFIRNMGTTDVENTRFRLETATYQQLTDEDISTIKSKGYILYNGNTIV